MEASGLGPSRQDGIRLSQSPVGAAYQEAELDQGFERARSLQRRDRGDQLIRDPLWILLELARRGQLSNRGHVPVAVIRRVGDLELVGLAVVLKAREPAVMQRAFG